MCWRIKCGAVVAAVAAVVVAGTAGVYAQVIPPGQDCLETKAGGTWLQFGGTSSIPPIPADFFFPGSQPYAGVVPMLGDPIPGYIGAVNTVVERKDYADVSIPYDPVTVLAEVKELHLKSQEPIIVDGPPGRAESFFDVFVTLNPNVPSEGFMTIQSTGPGGGTFAFRGREDGGFTLYPRFIFVPVAGGDSIVWDPGDPPGSHSEFLESVNPQPWQYATPALTCAPDQLFYPVPGEPLATVLDGGRTGEHGVTSPRQETGCCLPPPAYGCIDIAPEDCLYMGGIVQPTLCAGYLEGCCIPRMIGAGMDCVDMDPVCCDDWMGIPQGAGSVCTGLTIPCCLDDGTCVDVDQLCCDDLQGTPGHGTQCLTDLNGNGIDDACECYPTPDGQACSWDCPTSGSLEDVCVPYRIRLYPSEPEFFPAAAEDVLTGTTGYIVVEDPLGVQTSYPIRESPPNLTRVIRESPVDLGTHREVASEIIEMELVADGGVGSDIIIRESPTRISAGHMVGATDTDSDYPADSFFDLFVEIDIPDLGVYGLWNNQPIPLTALGITEVPPLGSPFVTGANWWGVDLLDIYGEPTGYRIIEVEHILPPPPPPPPWGAVFPAADEDVLGGTTGFIVVKDPGGVPTSYPIRESPNLTRVIRESPVDMGGYREVAAEITEMELMAGGGGGGGAILIRESPTRASSGHTEGAVSATTDYPADSFFDLFVEIDIPDLGAYGLWNGQPIPLATYAITALPPLGDAYATPVGWSGVELLDVYGDPTGYQIVQVEHRLAPPPPLWQIIECRCFDPGYCHIDWDGSPFCTGSCPYPEECREFSVTNPDGSVDYWCACVPVATEACCFIWGDCQDMDPNTCLAIDGWPQGPGTQCTEPAACCVPDPQGVGMNCVMVDPLCCDELGGNVQPAGEVCTQPEACCVPSMIEPGIECLDVDPVCCDDLLGTPQGAGTVCGDVPPIACCLQGGAVCENVHPLCCDELDGYQGFVSPCQGDLNHNGIDDACEIAENDLGDAPDSTNSWFVPMTAYPWGPGALANFPTVYRIGSPPFGPIHWLPRAVAWLGEWVSLENEADVGPDEDPTNNLIPPTDTPDLDRMDDGVIFPLVLPHCQWTTFNFIVTVVSPPPTEWLYVNVWFDWNRDGDWDDLQLCGLNDFAPEWSVQNQQLAFAGPGQYMVTTLPFKPWHPTPGTQPIPIWMRITLSEQPWISSGGPGEGGSGPQLGYQYGETEDYYVEDYISDITPPNIASAESRATHGTAGTFGVSISLTATGTSVANEPRVFVTANP
ncbi:MAG: GEVED domain-containing protein, partial [Planctomycetota bacterium]